MRQPFTLAKRRCKRGYVWYYSVWDGDKRRFLSTGQRLKERAKEYAERVVGASYTPTATKPLREFATPDFFMEGGAYRPWSEHHGGCPTPSTLDTYQKGLDEFRKAYGERQMLSITGETIEEWAESLIRQGLAQKTVQVRLSGVKPFFAWATARKHVPSNPFKDFRMTFHAPAPREAFTADEVAKLFSDPRLWGNRVLPRLVCEVMACTGMRVGEAVSLRMEDLEEGGWLRVRRNVTTHGFKPPKNGRERLVPLPDGLRERITRHAEGGWLFPSPTSRYGVLTEGSITSALSLACRNAGVRQLTPHSLRHFFNSQISVASVNPSAARSILGHGSPAMTDHYFHLGASDSSSVREIQGRILGSMA